MGPRSKIRRAFEALSRAAAAIVLGLIQLYRYLISPLFPRSCRFYPTCSHYAHEAVSRHGLIRGTALAAVRISRCHPWNPGGVDPVPPSAPLPSEK